MMGVLCSVVVLVTVGAAGSGPESVYFQAHRGGLKEVPENTLAAYRYAWDLGAIPEVDICATKDEVIICLHDDTLKRTTNATVHQDVPVSQLTFEEIRQWDAGSWFDPKFAGEKVPSLEEVLKEMAERKKAQIYLDLKVVDLNALGRLIAKYGVANRVIFCHNKVESCRTMREAVPGLRTMLWIGGKPADIQAKFRQAAAEEFEGLNQVQLHLHAAPKSENGTRYLLDEAFLREALAITRDKRIDLEVLPFEFDCASLSNLLDLGIRWYATDEPKRFKACVSDYFGVTGE
ncbi:MAG: glycerophosphodiester phosphodiesterase [Candidatus Hydrogenedentales bacterium]|jgi:glycerophosphoryl diester phosphodiesterase